MHASCGKRTNATAKINKKKNCKKNKKTTINQKTKPNRKKQKKTVVVAVLCTRAATKHIPVQQSAKKIKS